MRKFAVVALWVTFAQVVCAASDSISSPILVELFTSEACSSCPPADALLAKLDQMRREGGPGVLVLGEHVDYWNHLGWKDRFSSAQFSRRQSLYARHFALDSVYTPQMVIDGRYEIVGNDEAGVRQKISLAAQKQKEVGIALSWKGSVLILDARGTDTSAADLFVAITENGLSTSVARGENGGRTLRHNGVVRELRRVGSLSHGELSTAIALQCRPDWKTKNLRIIAFAQNPVSGEITGAAGLDFTSTTAKQTGR